MIISKLSKKHPCEDICDDLAGDYPKLFVFTGWHPQCFCYVTPILGDEDEMAKITDAFLEGNDYEPQFEQLEEYPKGFQKWVKDHKKQIEKSIKQGKEPYFVMDNRKVVEGIMHSGVLYKGTGMGRNATKQAMASFPDNYKGNANYSAEQLNNFKDAENKLGIKRRKSMTFKEADSGKENINNYKDNCVCCVVAHELRRRGFDVTASFADEVLYDDVALPWKTIKGKKPQIEKIKGSLTEIEMKLMKITSNGGRYNLMWDDKSIGGHIISVERINDKLWYYDPQKNLFWDIEEIYLKAKEDSIGLFRVDRLCINTDEINRAVKTID